MKNVPFKKTDFPANVMTQNQVEDALQL